MVGVRGLEPRTSATRKQRASQLRHTPLFVPESLGITLHSNSSLTRLTHFLVDSDRSFRLPNLVPLAGIEPTSNP